MSRLQESCKGLLSERASSLCPHTRLLAGQNAHPPPPRPPQIRQMAGACDSPLQSPLNLIERNVISAKHRWRWRQCRAVCDLIWAGSLRMRWAARWAHFNGLSLGRGVQAERQRIRGTPPPANMGCDELDIWNKPSRLTIQSRGSIFLHKKWRPEIQRACVPSLRSHSQG